MNTRNLALIILAGLGVTACGSSGDSSSHHTESKREIEVPSVINGKTVIINGKEVTGTATDASESSNPSTPKEEPKKEQVPPTVSDIAKGNAYANITKAIVGAGFSIDKNAGKIESLAITGNTKNDFNKFNIDGKVIEVLPAAANIDSQSTMYRQTKDSDIHRYRLVGANESYIRWGFVDDPQVTKKYIVSTGINPTLTENLPNTNNITYRGYAVHMYSKDGSKSLSDLIESKAEFTVNFADKNLVGQISPLPKLSSFTPVKLEAKIENNYFKGNANGIETEGAFFGPNAEEMTGSYIRQTDEPALGVFGAKKQ